MVGDNDEDVTMKVTITIVVTFRRWLWWWSWSLWQRRWWRYINPVSQQTTLCPLIGYLSHQKKPVIVCNCVLLIIIGDWLRTHPHPRLSLWHVKRIAFRRHDWKEILFVYYWGIIDWHMAELKPQVRIKSIEWNRRLNRRTDRQTGNRKS